MTRPAATLYGNDLSSENASTGAQVAVIAQLLKQAFLTYRVAVGLDILGHFGHAACVVALSHAVVEKSFRLLLFDSECAARFEKPSP